MRASPGHRESPPEQRPRWQFSLRQLLVLTAVVAAFLGTLLWDGGDTAPVAFLASWIALVAIVRAMFGIWVAGILSIVVAMLLVGLPLYAHEAYDDPSANDRVELFLLFLGVAWFATMLGFLVLLAADVVCHCFRWIGAFLQERKRDSKDGD
jgi:hypothetical protein